MTETPHTDGGSEGDQSPRPGRIAYEIDDDESTSEAVVRAVSAFTNTPPLDLEPLYDAIDPDHLDGLLNPGARTDDGIEFTFTFNGCRVTVTRGEVAVELADGEGGPATPAE